MIGLDHLHASEFVARAASSLFLSSGSEVQFRDFDVVDFLSLGQFTLHFVHVNVQDLDTEMNITIVKSIYNYVII